MPRSSSNMALNNSRKGSSTVFLVNIFLWPTTLWNWMENHYIILSSIKNTWHDIKSSWFVLLMMFRGIIISSSNVYIIFNHYKCFIMGLHLLHNIEMYILSIGNSSLVCEDCQHCCVDNNNLVSSSMRTLILHNSIQISDKLILNPTPLIIMKS